MHRYRFLSFLILILLPLVFISCSVEQKVASSYQKEIKETPVMLRLNQEIFLTNSKLPIPDGISDDDKQAYYDTAFNKSDFIQYIDGNRYLERFNNILTEAIMQQGFKVYPTDSITNFLNSQKPSVIVEIEQFEIEEYYSEYEDDYYFSPASAYDSQNGIRKKDFINKNSIYISYYDNGDINCSVYFDANTISVNAWVNISIMYKDGSQTQELVFMQYEISDDIDGTFSSLYNTYERDVKYKYELKPLVIEDLYRTEKHPPAKFSQLIANYLVNHVIEHRLNNTYNIEKKREWEYSKKSGRILPISTP